MLKQIGVSSSSKKRDCLIAGYIGNDPVALYMTFRKTLQITVELMFPAVFRQGLFPDNFCHNVIKSFKLIMAFFRQLEVFLELVCEIKIKHSEIADGRLIAGRFVRILPTQNICPNFFKFVRFMPLYRDFSAHNSFGFFKSRQSNGVIGQGSSFGISEFSANRTFAVNSYIKSFSFVFCNNHKKPLYLKYTQCIERIQERKHG